MSKEAKDQVKALRVGQRTTFQAHGHSILVKYHSRNTYFAKRTDITTNHARWGTLLEIVDDVEYFHDTGALPRSGQP